MQFPVLCLSRVGFPLIRSPEELRRSSASLVAAGFYKGLRVVDARGAVYDVVYWEILRPRSGLGQAMARLFDATVTVDAEFRPAGSATLGEVVTPLKAQFANEPAWIEEMTGRTAKWWDEMLSQCADAGEVVRAIDSANRTV